jgi:hypothetical protein
MREQQFLRALEQHGSALATGDLGAKSDIYQEHAVCEYPNRVNEYNAREI